MWQFPRHLQQLIWNQIYTTQIYRCDAVHKCILGYVVGDRLHIQASEASVCVNTRLLRHFIMPLLHRSALFSYERFFNLYVRVCTTLRACECVGGGDRASHCCVLTSKPVFGSHPTWPMCLENIVLSAESQNVAINKIEK